jgi:rSAM/selenodomain-associated transferase 1
MHSPDARIIVFAKAPVPGQCKTRLIPALGEQGAAELHARLVWQALTTATQDDLCPVELWCADQADHPFFKQCQEHFAITIKQQQGSDVGLRMAHAFAETLNHCQRAACIGSDCPALQSDDLKQALTALEQHDCVLKPADDGGYVLIGLRQAYSSVFENIAWGSAHVMEQTRIQLNRQQLSWQELPPTWDLDRPEELDKLNALQLNNTYQLPLISV